MKPEKKLTWNDLVEFAEKNEPCYCKPTLERDEIKEMKEGDGEER